MLIYNSYIFLDNNIDVPPQKGNKEKKIVINLGRRVFDLLKETFSLQDDGDIDRHFFSYQAKKLIMVGGASCPVSFNCNEVDRTTYLNIRIEGSTKAKMIGIMEYIHATICGPGNLFDNQFTCIVSYDSISEYYCNKFYPKLNEFERSLRRLMFNIYTFNLGFDYLQKTTGEKLHKAIQQKVLHKQPETMKPKDKEKLLKSAFYSLDFNDIQTLLFEKRWTDYDEEQKTAFLTKTKNLSELPDAELRKYFSDMEPKSDWNRFFIDKIVIKNIEEDIELLRQTRNKVAHNKHFSKDEFQQSVRVINKLIKAINEVIVLTEERDFVAKNQQRLEMLGKNISEAMEKVSSRFSEVFTAFNKEYTMRIKNILQPIGSLNAALAAIYKTALANQDIDQDEADNETNT